MLKVMLKILFIPTDYPWHCLNLAELHVIHSEFCYNKLEEMPVSIAEPSKAFTVSDCLNIEIAGWNPLGAWMCVCVFLCGAVLCVGRSLALD
jgi:hypothetical protein